MQHASQHTANPSPIPSAQPYFDAAMIPLQSTTHPDLFSASLFRLVPSKSNPLNALDQDKHDTGHVGSVRTVLSIRGGNCDAINTS